MIPAKQNPPARYFTTGVVIERLKTDWNTFHALIENMGIGPAFYINNVGHYEAGDVDRIEAAIFNRDRK